MWGKASQRDKDRAIRALSELRLAQSKDYQRAGDVMNQGVAAAHQVFTQALQDAYRDHSRHLLEIDRKLSRIESLTNTVLNSGANLDAKLSGGERRQQTEKARRLLDELLVNVERERGLARKQAACEHEWVATGINDDIIEDGKTQVEEGECSKCKLKLAIPSAEHTALEDSMNEEKPDEPGTD